MIPGKYLLFGGNGEGSDDFGKAVDEMIALTGKVEPSFLYIGFAQLLPFHGFEYYGVLFAARGCPCALLTDDDVRDGAAAKKKIDNADVIFITGGNTAKLMNTLRENGIDTMLREAAAGGKVMAGFSAGAICLCEKGASKNDDYVTERGIGCLDFTFCPHSLTSPARYSFFENELEKDDSVGLAFDGAGFEVMGDKCRALITCPEGCMTRVLTRTENGRRHTELSDEWIPLSDLRSGSHNVR